MCGTHLVEAIKPAYYCLKEVSLHNTPQDCWVIVHGKVYDVSDFVPRHPGGALIYAKAGGECSQLFDSYHPLRARRTLDKYCIGRLDPKEVILQYDKQGDDDEFYLTLKRKVEAYFRLTKQNPRSAVSLYVKALLIAACVATSSSLAYYMATSYQVALACAAVMGLGMAEVGVSIQHDANHGAFCRNSTVCYLVGLTLDAIGASSFMWKQQHVVGHHAFTNVVKVDPDIRVKPSGADVRRVSPSQPLGSQHAYQHLYLGLLYGLLAVKSILVDDFNALLEGQIGSVKVAKQTRHEMLVFWSGKLFFALWFFVGPLMFSHWSLIQLLGLWTAGLFVAGWTLALLFQVAHVVGDVDFLEHDSTTGRLPGSWAEQQVATSADFCHGSWFWTHFSGGLNYQVVHHLFPGIAHAHYPQIAPIVRAVADEFGVPYKVYPTFWSAVAAHFRHLHSVGSLLTMPVPSLQTVG